MQFQAYNPYQFQPQYQPQYQPQFQQQTQQVQRPVYQGQGIAGRTVQCESDIAPSEVPMDGSTSWFPLSDGSAVYSKRWNADGTITTLRYVMASDPEPEKQLTVEDVNKLIDMRLASIGGEAPIGNHVRSGDERK